MTENEKKRATHKKYLESLWLDGGISENWTLWFNVHEDEGTSLERKPCNISGIDDCKGNMRGHSFPCLKDKRPFDVRLTLCRTPTLGRFNSRWRKREKKIAVINIFRKYNKYSPALQQMLKILPSWPDVVSIPEKYLAYSLDFLSGNCWNLTACTCCLSNTNFFVMKKHFVKKSWICSTPLPVLRIRLAK